MNSHDSVFGAFAVVTVSTFPLPSQRYQQIFLTCYPPPQYRLYTYLSNFFLLHESIKKGDIRTFLTVNYVPTSDLSCTVTLQIFSCLRDQNTALSTLQYAVRNTFNFVTEEEEWTIQGDSINESSSSSNVHIVICKNTRTICVHLMTIVHVRNWLQDQLALRSSEQKNKRENENILKFLFSLKIYRSSSCKVTKSS